MLAVLVSAAAWAQDAVSLEYVKVGQVETSNPSFTVIANDDAANLDVSFSCGAASGKRAGAARKGERWEFPLVVPTGTHNCRGSLSVALADGSEGEMPLSFTIKQFPRLAVRTVAGSLDVPNRKVSVTLDRTASRVEITVLGPKGVELGGGNTHSSAPAGTAIECAWTQSSGEAMKLQIKGYDENGFFGNLELSPWRYSVPHEDVNFATNSAVIEPGEEPKLAAAMSEVQGVLDKYGSDVVIKLYVAGHTDTVGDATKNQALSMDRAKSIAGWFKRHGFDGDIYYQGFGERDLAVATADGIDELRNRRVAYTLAAQSPDMPASLGDLSWLLLR
jgi:outer membrane protein OmpA-like peptidoglycan-associated protein